MDRDVFTEDGGRFSADPDYPERGLLRESARAIEWAAVALGALMTFVVLAQAILRYLFSLSFAWSQELIRVLFIYVTIFGAMVAYERGENLRVPFWWRQTHRTYGLAYVVSGGLLAWVGTGLSIRVATRETAASLLGFPEWALFAPVAFFGLFVALIGLRTLFNRRSNI